MAKLTHLDETGAAHMVDVGGKATTARVAVAAGRIVMSAAALTAIRDQSVAKGDVLAVARIAGVLAAKRTGELIPLCHPLALDRVGLDFAFEDAAIAVTATAATTARTGVEMEAMTAATVALLTIYDMAKAIDKAMTIGDVRLLSKTGGKSGDWQRVTGLISVPEARLRLAALAPPVAGETVPLAQAAGRWAASDITASRTQPYADLSAMDGYAIRFADLPGPFALAGESAAGKPFAGAVAAGQTVRIFTGATMPEGADTVMIQEEVEMAGEHVALVGEGPATLGRNVRRRGLDFSAGDVLVEAGERLSASRIAVVATAGRGALPVRRRLRVAIVATGDELAPPGAPLADGMLPESNGAMLCAMLGDMPVDIEDHGILPDRLDTIRDRFRSIDADLLVTTGGASVGDHDLIRPALIAAGGTIDFWRIALRPGKPMLAGRLDGTVVLGLPGNPVSAFVTATLFVKPLIAAMMGARDPAPRLVPAPLGEPLPANDHREDYLRAAWHDGAVWSAAIQDSSMLRTLARSDCLIYRAPNAPPAAASDIVNILPLA